MSSILKKLQAVIILMLMIFSVSFNVIDYGMKSYAADGVSQIIDDYQLEVSVVEDNKNPIYINVHTKQPLKDKINIQIISGDADKVDIINCRMETLTDHTYVYQYKLTYSGNNKATYQIKVTDGNSFAMKTITFQGYEALGGAFLLTDLSDEQLTTIKEEYNILISAHYNYTGQQTVFKRNNTESNEIDLCLCRYHGNDVYIKSGVEIADRDQVLTTSITKEQQLILLYYAVSGQYNKMNQYVWANSSWCEPGSAYSAAPTDHVGHVFVNEGYVEYKGEKYTIDSFGLTLMINKYVVKYVNGQGELVDRVDDYQPFLNVYLKWSKEDLPSVPSLYKVKEDGTTALSGAEFKIYEATVDANNYYIRGSSSIGTVTSGSEPKDISNIVNNTSKTYWIEESKAPNGYTKSNQVAILYYKDGSWQVRNDVKKSKDNDAKGVALGSDSPDWSYDKSTAKLTLKDTPAGPPIYILKTDGKDPLSGATFKVYEAEYKDGNYYRKDKIGKDITSTNEAIDISDIINEPYKVYWIEETGAPEGYNLSDQVLIYQIQNNDNVFQKAVKTSGEGVAPNKTVTDPDWTYKKEENKVTLTLKDTPGGNLEIFKVKEDGTTPLAGVEFGIYEYNSTLAVKEGLKTDSNGRVKLPALADGDYLIKETKVPYDEYTLITLPAHITIENGNISLEESDGEAPISGDTQNGEWKIIQPTGTDETVVLKAINKKGKKIKLIKEDEEGNPISGVKVTYYQCKVKSNGEVEKVGEAHELEMDGKEHALPSGYLWLEEDVNSVPEGYIASNQVAIINVTNSGDVTIEKILNKKTNEEVTEDTDWVKEGTGDNIKLTLKNKKSEEAKIKIHKISDKNNGSESLPGANFTIYECKEDPLNGGWENKKFYKSDGTSTDGNTKEITLETGKYYVIQETQAPTYKVKYQQTNQVYTFKVDEEGKITNEKVAVLENDSLSELKGEESLWSKKDGETYVLELINKPGFTVKLIKMARVAGKNEPENISNLSSPFQIKAYKAEKVDTKWVKGNTVENTFYMNGKEQEFLSPGTYWLVEDEYSGSGDYDTTKQGFIITVDQNRKITARGIVDEEGYEYRGEPDWEFSSEEISITLYNKKSNKIKVEIQKVDSKDNKFIQKTARFQAVDDTGESLPIEITNGKQKTSLTAGKSYTITEEEAPEGYKKSDGELKITVNENGTITADEIPEGWECNFTDPNNYTIKVPNEKIQLDKYYLSIYKSANIPKKTSIEEALSGSTKDYRCYFGLSVSRGNAISDKNLSNFEVPVNNSMNFEPIEIKPDQNGNCIINITENRAPEGFNAITDTITININENSEPKLLKNIKNVYLSYNIEENNGEKVCKIILTAYNQKDDATYNSYPLLMQIEGNVWLDELQGKNSEANGVLDDEAGDKRLEGIIVELFEEDGTKAQRATSTNVESTIVGIKNVPKYVTEHITKLKEEESKQGDGPTNVLVTDEKGHFGFYGLDPKKKYYVKFTYNGMRYQEVREVVKNININGFAECSLGTEDTTIRREITTTFSEIGTYPYNYWSDNLSNWNYAYTQADVESAIQGGLSIAGNYLNLYGDSEYSNLGNYILDKNLVSFIKDTRMEAKTEPVGAVLANAEDDIEKYHAEMIKPILNKGNAEFVYPVVREHTVNEGEFISGNEKRVEQDGNVDEKLLENVRDENSNLSEAYKKAVRCVEELMNTRNSLYVGYYIEEYKYVKTQTRTTCDQEWKWVGGNSEETATTFRRYSGVATGYYKGEMVSKLSTEEFKVPSSCHHLDKTGHYDPTTGGWEYYTCNQIDGSLDGTCGEKDILLNKTEYVVKMLSIEEGYDTYVMNHIRFARFEMDGQYTEPYLFTDHKDWKSPYNDKFGIDSDYGWNSSNRDPETIYKELSKNLGIIITGKDENGTPTSELVHGSGASSNGITRQSLGLVYRPTMDLGLISNVIEAYVNVNNREATYKYDKRAANGEIFKFGVNEYDLQNGTENIEQQYAEYYKNLSERNIDAINNENTFSSSEEYTHYLKKEDIHPNDEIGITDNGSAEAGGYGAFDVNITITYELLVRNQSGTEAAVTELVDYIEDGFSVVGVYTDREKTQRIGFNQNSIYANRGSKSTDGKKAIYIPVTEKYLKNNEDLRYYVEIKMDNPRAVLTDARLQAGYKVYNFAEINGYKTKIGVIDIDSNPGNLLLKKNVDGSSRYEMGVYEDDESKSPAMIFTYDGVTRTVSGTFFEDKTSLDLDGEVKSYTGQERTGNGKLDDDDSKVYGGTVRLIEVDASGTPIKSNANTEDLQGLRAQTQTTAEGKYEFKNITAGQYIIEFVYGDNEKSVLVQQVSPEKTSNTKSYTGQDFEYTERLGTYTNDGYWYANRKEGNYNLSDAVDNAERRTDVTEYSQKLTNEKAEVFNSYKDSNYNEELLQKLMDKTYMIAETDKMTLEVENIQNYPDKKVTNAINRTKDREQDYIVNNVNFGIVERERAELQITKKVYALSLLDSSGKEITSGKFDEDKVKYTKWLKGDFVDLEIDKEILQGATLQITYALTVTNTSEAGNEIKNIQVVDYVSNNLNYSSDFCIEKYSEVKPNSANNWDLIKVEDLKNSGYVSKESLESDNMANSIDLSTYQVILFGDFGNIAPGGKETKYLTLQKVLSSREESDFNFENHAEIVSSYNENGRADYSSIYGNLDPATNTSKQGRLHWDYVGPADDVRGIRQMRTSLEYQDKETKMPVNSIRVAEKDSGNAEEVIITPPTGKKGIVFGTKEYAMTLTLLSSIIAICVLMKKYYKLKE